jgi:hypothetical protein
VEQGDQFQFQVEFAAASAMFQFQVELAAAPEAASAMFQFQVEFAAASTMFQFQVEFAVFVMMFRPFEVGARRPKLRGEVRSSG